MAIYKDTPLSRHKTYAYMAAVLLGAASLLSSIPEDMPVWAATDPAPVANSNASAGNQEGLDPDEALLKKLEAEGRQREYDTAVDNIMPLSPDQIRSLRRKQDVIDEAVSAPPAKMRTETRQLHVTPGAAPQVIRMTGGYSSTIVFQDMTGKPWPVLSMILGNPESFSAVQPKNASKAITTTEKRRRANASETDTADLSETEDNVTSNVINIVPLSNRESSNLAVNLQGCPYPVILHLLTESPLKGQRSAVALVVFRLDKRGPQAEMPQIAPSSGTDTVSEEALGFMHGVPPQDASVLPLTPPLPGTRIWKYRGKLYLRTSHAVVWPAWNSLAMGDDIRVYTLPPTRSLVLSINGEHQKVVLDGGK